MDVEGWNMKVKRWIFKKRLIKDLLKIYETMLCSNDEKTSFLRSFSQSLYLED